MAKHPTKIHEANLTLNQRIALFIANLLGSPWTIYLFTILALISLPAVIESKNLVLIISWITQTFIQLVALAILQAKSVIDGSHSEEIANAIYDNAIRSEEENEEILDKLDELLGNQ